MSEIDAARFSRQEQARRALWRRLTPAERADRAMQYALFWLLADEPTKLERGERLAIELFQRLQNEYRMVVAPGRRTAGLPEWTPPPGFFPAPRSEATRQKIGAANRRRIWTTQSRAKIASAMHARRHSATTKIKMSNSAAVRARDESGRFVQGATYAI